MELIQSLDFAQFKSEKNFMIQYSTTSFDVKEKCVDIIVALTMQNICN